MNRRAIDERSQKGLSAFITGGTRGIGRAVVQELLPKLRQLTVLARSPEELRALEDLIDSDYPHCNFTALRCDLGNLDELARRLDELPQDPLDVLVLNAGVFTEGALAEIPIDDFLRDQNINLNSSVVIVQGLLGRLRAGSQRRIVIIGSTAALEPYPLVPSYGVAKWGLRGLAINLRQELVADRVGVTFLCPGGTLTDMWAGEELAPNRLLQPKDVALLVASLLQLSEQAVVEEIVVRPMLGDIHE